MLISLTNIDSNSIYCFHPNWKQIRRIRILEKNIGCMKSLSWKGLTCFSISLITDWIFLLPWVFLIALLAYPVYYLIRGFQKADREANVEKKKARLSDLISGAFILFILSLVIFGIFWGLPELILARTDWLWLATPLRWILLFWEYQVWSIYLAIRMGKIAGNIPPQGISQCS